MARIARFKPRKTPSGKWVLNIPAKFSPTGQRQRLFYDTKEKATLAADGLKDQRDTFGVQALAITPSLAEKAHAAALLLEPLGIDILEAVRRFVELENKLRASVPVEKAIAEFRAKGTNWSDSQATAYRIRGQHLVEAFKGRMISTITGEEIRQHLLNTTGTPSSYNHAVRLLRAIWRWCAKPPRQWCAVEAVEQLEKLETETGEIGILTPAQARAVMAAAETHFPDCVAPFAISLFTGMRQAELERLRPCDITEDGIDLPAASAKTKRRRFVQMPAPLAEWLKAYPIKETICPPNWPRKEKAVRRLAGFAVWSDLVPDLKLKPTKLDTYQATPPAGLPAWPQNALRHTAATMAVALGKSLKTLIFEHGHSGGVELLRKHYVGTMPKKDAAEIWRIGPKGEQLPLFKIA